MIRHVGNAANLAVRRKRLLERRIEKLQRKYEEDRETYFNLLSDYSTTKVKSPEAIMHEQNMRRLNDSIGRLQTKYSSMNDGRPYRIWGGWSA